MFVSLPIHLFGFSCCSSVICLCARICLSACVRTRVLSESRCCLLQYTYDVASYGIDAVDLLETDSQFAGYIRKYRVPPPRIMSNITWRVTNGTLADCAALASSGWGDVLDWIVPSTPSDWCCSATGITCGGSEGRITEIELPDVNVRGMRAPLLLFVRNLGALYFDLVNIWGYVFVCEVSNAVSLVFLWLHAQLLFRVGVQAGTLDPLRNFNGLQKLVLSRNSFEGMIMIQYIVIQTIRICVVGCCCVNTSPVQFQIVRVVRIFFWLMHVS
jgi:hypothetical protein